MPEGSAGSPSSAENRGRFPDLLHADGQSGLDLGRLREALTFAFAAGGGGSTFDEAVNGASVRASSWNPASFADDLFLADFVKRCMPLVIGGKRRAQHTTRLVRILSYPAQDAAAIAHRQSVLRELCATPALRRACEETWLDVHQLLQQLQAAELRGRLAPIRRRVEILRNVKASIDALAERFSSAQSGLVRLARFAEEVRAGQGYRQLSEVLDYEDNLATVDLRVRIGHDGELRGFAIERVTENRENRLYASPFRRFLDRLRVWFRGYHLRQNEILGRLVQQAFDGVLDELAALIGVQGDLEFYLAALGFRELAEKKGLLVCLPEVEAGPCPSKLNALFNPFLLHEERPPRPCDLEVPAHALVVVTGPNSGGKTRLLQAIGLTQLLAEAGAFVPAERASLPRRAGMFVSLAEPVSSDQTEGRLGSELLRIRKLFQEVAFGSLVILDELCSGTNPSEGEEIFELVMSLLDELEPQAFVITHFLRLAADLATTRPMQRLHFLQVELDPNERPTYGFVPGVAVTSLARNTAERLGVTRESLLALVEAKKRTRARSLPPSSRS